MKDLGDAIDAANKEGDYFIPNLVLGDSLVAGSTTSVASTRGSDVPTPVGEEAIRSSPKMSDLDGSSACGASLILVDSATTVESAVSNDSSFDEVPPMDADGVSDVATHGSSSTTTGDKIGPKTGGFKHKVRRSLGWWSASASSGAS